MPCFNSRKTDVLAEVPSGTGVKSIRFGLRKHLPLKQWKFSFEYELTRIQNIVPEIATSKDMMMMRGAAELIANKMASLNDWLGKV